MHPFPCKGAPSNQSPGFPEPSLTMLTAGLNWLDGMDEEIPTVTGLAFT